MRRARLLLPTMAVLLLLALGACGGNHQGGTSGHRRLPLEHLVVLQEVRLQPSRLRYLRTGTLEARRKVRIGNREEGLVTALPFDVGDHVEAGALLVRLDDTLLQTELAKARANTRQAEIDLRRVRDLLARNAASKDEVAKARTALEIARAEQRLLEQRLEHTRIYAPFAGVVTERLVQVGDLAARYGHLLTLADPGSLRVRLRLPDRLLARLHRDDAVRVRIDALPNGSFPGRIERISPTLDPESHTGSIEIRLDPLPPGARAGQLCRVRLQSAEKERLLIPFTALQRDKRGEFVFLYDADKGKALRAPVESGARIADQVEILHGLRPGQRLIVRGFLDLRDGKKVTPVHGEDDGAGSG